MECGAGTAAAAAPGCGHRPGAALGATGEKQVTFRRGRPLSGRSPVPARAAGGTCNLGGRGPCPSDTPPPRPGLPDRRALTCTASRSPRGLLGLGCADRTALGAALGVPPGAPAGGVRRAAAAAWAAEEEDSGAPLWGDPPSSRPLCSSRRRSLPGRGGAGRGADRHFLSTGPSRPRLRRTKTVLARARRSGIASLWPCDDRLRPRGTVIVPLKARPWLPCWGVFVSRVYGGAPGESRGGGLPPSCSWGLLGSVAGVFQSVVRDVACRRSRPGSCVGRLSWLEDLWTGELASADGLQVPFGGA